MIQWISALCVAHTYICTVNCTNLDVFDCDEDWHGDKISFDALEAGQGVLHVAARPPLGVGQPRTALWLLRPLLVHRGSTAEEVVPLCIGHLSCLSHDVNAEHEREHELVLLKETACHVGVHRLSGCSEEDLQPLLEVGGFLAALDARGEELLEVFEGELVHWVNFAEGSHHKVHHRACRTQDSSAMHTRDTS